MAVAAYTTMLNEVLPYVHDCPALVAEHALRNAAIEFCHKSQLWIYDVTAIDIVAGTATYTPTLVADTALVEVLQVWNGDNILHGRNQDELAHHYRHADWREKSGDPQFYYRDIPSAVVLVPNPATSVTGGLEMRVALTPTRASTTMESELIERYAEVIGWGARARVLAIPGQPFFDAAASALYERKFQAGITDARIRANRGTTRGASAVTYNTVRFL